MFWALFLKINFSTKNKIMTIGQIIYWKWKYINTNDHNFIIKLRNRNDTLSGLKAYKITHEIKVIKIPKKVKHEYIADIT